MEHLRERNGISLYMKAHDVRYRDWRTVPSLQSITDRPVAGTHNSRARRYERKTTYPPGVTEPRAMAKKMTVSMQK